MLWYKLKLAAAAKKRRSEQVHSSGWLPAYYEQHVCIFLGGAVADAAACVSASQPPWSASTAAAGSVRTRYHAVTIPRAHAPYPPPLSRWQVHAAAYSAPLLTIICLIANERIEYIN